MKLNINLIIIIPLLLFISPYIGAQNIQTYNGSYDRGTAKYSYYEDNELNRVFHGDFNLNGRLYNAKGKFTDGKENGIWNIWATNNERENAVGKFRINTDIKGSFLNGNFEGLWTYSNSFLLWNNFTKKYSDKEDKEVSTANFINNNFAGKISYSANWPSSLKIDGQFTDFGLLDGTWTIESSSKKSIIKYMNGVPYWLITQNKETGEKLDFFDKTEFVNNFWQNYDDLTHTSIVDGQKYCVFKKEIIINGSNVRLINPAIDL